MCLLFTQDPATRTLPLTDAQLSDMYLRNKDGFGVMYSADDCLHTDKGIGTVHDWLTFYRKYEGKKAAFHLRMRTHGHTDLTNCHPYDVFGFEEGQDYTVPLALMHNGILSTGNLADVSKSDTWHYIRDFLRPILEDNPQLIFKPAFIKMVGAHIGSSNKFCIMDNAGNLTTVNKHAGTEWNEMWFSNTYAWSADDDILYPGRPKKTYPTYGATWDASWNTGTVHTRSPVVAVKKLRKSKESKLKLIKAPGLIGTEKNVADRVGLLDTLAYMNDMLDFDIPSVGNKISAAQRVAMVNLLTPEQVESLMEDAFMGAIVDWELVKMFRQPHLATIWLRAPFPKTTEFVDVSGSGAGDCIIESTKAQLVDVDSNILQLQ